MPGTEPYLRLLKIRKLKLDSEPSWEIKYLTGETKAQGAVSGRARMPTRTASSQARPSQLLRHTVLPDRFSRQLRRGLASALTSYEVNFKMICDSETVYAY